VFVYLVHHGVAVEPLVDPQRPLSSRGRGDVERLAADAAARGAKPQVVWHSGKLRARQTAEAFWRACNPLADLTAVRGLQPADPPEWMRDQLAGESRDVLIAGHFPHLPGLLRLLTAGHEDATTGFPKHGMVALEATEAGYAERWRLQHPAAE
jgi:phosphohistidine phosphatase